MDALKSTPARQVVKSEDLSQPGDFVFIPNWPEYDAVIFSCPFCGNSLTTMPTHTMVRRDPLTIEGAVACPYSVRDLTYVIVKCEPPKGLWRRLWWSLFGKKTRGVSKPNPHAFFVRDGKITPA
jgi:hypothetical protein